MNDTAISHISQLFKLEWIKKKKMLLDLLFQTLFVDVKYHPYVVILQNIKKKDCSLHKTKT